MMRSGISDFPCGASESSFPVFFSPLIISHGSSGHPAGNVVIGVYLSALALVSACTVYWYKVSFVEDEGRFAFPHLFSWPRKTGGNADADITMVQMQQDLARAALRQRLPPLA